ncbi:MAG: Hsp20/alpha crystallin family protein [archaeon]
MTLIRYRPGLLEDFFGDVFPWERTLRDLYRDFVVGDFEGLKGNYLVPRGVWDEKEDKYIANLDIPGVKKENIKMTLDDRVINVEAGVKTEVEEGKRKEISERFYKGTFSIPLNASDDIASITSKYENGVLRIEIPKVEYKPEEKKVTEIKID